MSGFHLLTTWQGEQMLALIQQQIHRPCLEILVHAAVGNLIKPPADLDVGCADIKMQSALFQPGLQRIHKTGSSSFDVELTDLDQFG